MFGLAAASAFWLGVLTSISPCPLATNIAAISFISRRLDHPRQAVWAGLLYTLGRTLTYLGLAAALVLGFSAIPELSRFLQKYMNQLLGPILILAGMFLLEMIPLRLPETVKSERLENQARKTGPWSALGLGALFALSFCPVSAALFFGSLVPLSVKYQSAIIMPLLYGIGTGLPVAVFAVMIALGVRSLGRAFDRLSRVEKWVRRGAGAIFILVGIYYALTFIFGLP